MNKNTKRYRIKSKFRFITFIVIMLGLTISACGYFTGVGISTALSEPVNQIEIEVAHGDTLWDIAYEFKSSDKDIRKAVYEICQANDISDGQIKEGMTLKIPQNL